MEPEEVGEVFEELARSGKVRYFGVSNMNRYQMELLSSGVKRKLWADQLQMSLAHTPLIDAGINVNTHFDGVFLGDDEYPELNSVLNKLAKKYGVSADAIAYAWLLRYPAGIRASDWHQTIRLSSERPAGIRPSHVICPRTSLSA